MPDRNEEFNFMHSAADALVLQLRLGFAATLPFAGKTLFLSVCIREVVCLRLQRCFISTEPKLILQHSLQTGEEAP